MPTEINPAPQHAPGAAQQRPIPARESVPFFGGDVRQLGVVISRLQRRPPLDFVADFLALLHHIYMGEVGRAMRLWQDRASSAVDRDINRSGRNNAHVSGSNNIADATATAVSGGASFNLAKEISKAISPSFASLLQHLLGNNQGQFDFSQNQACHLGSRPN
eukprot:scaffold200421_cov36-Prasinocladus_malaysianus.AAC.1